MLKIKQVALMTSLAPASIRRMYAKGTFPAPMKLSVGRYAWRESDVQGWLDKLEAVTNGNEIQP